MKNTKVCQILFSGLGGHGSVVFSIISADSEKQWEHSLVFYGVETILPSFVSRCEKSSIPYTFVSKKQGVVDRTSFRAVYAFLKQQQPDVILLHSPPLVHVAHRYCMFHRCRLVVIEHNNNSIKSRLEWIFSRLSFFMADKLVYLTEFYKEEIRKRIRLSFRERKVEVIPNGIDTDLFAPSRSVSKGLPATISMISRFTKIKDHATLLKAFSILQRENFEDIRLVLAGDGETLDEMKKMAEDLSLFHVDFPGSVSEQGISDLLKQTTIYVQSTFRETMSTSIMQAMSCGVPVLGSDVEGVRNMISEHTGQLFEFGNAEELAAKLRSLLLDPQRRATLSTNARNYAIREFSATRMFQSYNLLIQELKNK